MSFDNVGKGWFNINERSREIYDISKMSRFMMMVKLRMQGALRNLVLSSAQSYVSLVETPCLCTLGVSSDFVWGSDLVETQFKPSAAPIFTLKLNVNEAGAFYSTDPAMFEKTTGKLFDNAVISSHKIPQVEPMLMEHLKYAEDLYLSSVGLQETVMQPLRERLLVAVRSAVVPLVAYCREYDRHAALYSLDVDEYIEKYKEENHPVHEVKEEVALHLRLKANLVATIPAVIVIGPFIVQVDNLRQFLINKRQEIATKLLNAFAQRMKELLENVMEEYKTIYRRLCEKPATIELLVEMREWMETIPLTVRGLDDTARRYLLEYDLLDSFWFALDQEEFEAKWEALSWPNRLTLKIEEVERQLELETEIFQKLQIEDEFTLQDRIELITGTITQLAQQSDFSKVHEIAVDVRRAWKLIKETQEFGQLLNSRQKLFGMPVTPFDQIRKLSNEFEPYKNLWTTASDWLKSYQIYMDNPLVNLDGEAMERNVSESYKIISKCYRTFVEMPVVQEIACRVKEEIDQFKPYMPLILAVRNPGMRQRHWEDLTEKTGIKIKMTSLTTFNNCLSLGLMDHTDVAVKLSEEAAKEYVIEQALDKMEAEWESVNLDVSPYKATGTYIMKVTDDMVQMLDDHIVATQQLSFSPFKGAFEERLAEWEDKLRLTQQVIEEWSECQKTWMYLEPIFKSEDIKNQLPLESKKFNTMERAWRRTMKLAFETPKIMSFCPDKRLLDLLKDNNKLLDMVYKGLSDYLETKRSSFPRFYFLSDDELLEILSQGRNPLAVQPHLRKCFENIAKLHFEPDLRITKMFSAEGECVDLIPDMYPTGMVEAWLLKVEQVMRNTLCATLEKALNTIEHQERSRWVLEWPGQLVIAGCQTYWSAHVEEGIHTHTLEAYYQEMLAQLDGLRGLVRGKLTRIQRQVLSALIVIEVHARDVLFNLVQLNVQNVNEFDWISQLRYYWVEGNLKVRAVNAEFPYGYEYLGNSGRLVITPLTDRCYLTLTGALHLKFGGAPAGPAGTGKTETTKDLAKAFAIQCVVFNCSDQLDFMAMGKFFKGLASSGAWACFDEFNRIDIEVLSVVAQQITTIQKAQQARAERFMFEGAEVALKPSCAVFITMNPGYAGRTELPDNLKALFRPVAMMVPNYALIAEISLFSFGFGNAKELANKITTTFKLSSEQLSSQDHYDFGMRAVKTVISVAGNLKRENPTMDDRQIVLRALRDVNVPKFLRDDLKLFNGIVSDLFPRMVEQPVDYGELEKSIRAVTVQFGLEDVDDYVRKVIQLFETTVVRHGLMLVGPTGSGKTKCYEILKDALTALKGQPSPTGSPFESVHTSVLNPKSITMGQLYGEFDALTHEWTDGILPSLVRVGVACPDQDKFWYVFDGPVDAVWIENMNTVLDDNKKLCLTSGEIIKLTDNQTMMFEVADLAVASPATVSRCGMVYLEPSVLGLQPFFNCWLQRLPKLGESLEPLYRELFSLYLLPALRFLRSHMVEMVPSVDSALVQSCLRLLDCFMLPLTCPGGKPPPSPAFLNLLPELVSAWVVYAVIWSVGATCDHSSRELFSSWMRKTMKEDIQMKPLFPGENLVYDYRLHDGGFTGGTDTGEPSSPRWIHWMDGLETYVITADMKYSDIEVPTIDNVRNAHLMGTLLSNEANVLCIGPTGTGKTVTVMSKLSRNMPKQFLSDFINFSARTSANQTQDLIDSKLDRRRKGVFGPPVLKRLVLFIDDLNMPALETYGAQPPIELIRQRMDFRGWYDRKSIGEFRLIVDVNFVCAMGPPGGGRNPVTARLLRHFNYLAFPEMQDDSKRCIFGTILRWWLDQTQGQTHLLEPTLAATLAVYITVVRELLPTPAKTHYTFNLRDLSHVFQGMLMVAPAEIQRAEDLVRIWYHENTRVFRDRLVNDKDREWFSQLLRDTVNSQFNLTADQVLQTEEELLYGDFMNKGADVKLYQRITDSQKLFLTLQDYLQDYNDQSTSPMRLVLFSDAVAHVCRISRIIRQPQGNALLLGMGGSGRQSLTRLATYMAESTCFQIELSKTYGSSEWKEDIKGLMLRAGLYNKETVFLFSDTQIKKESFLEDLNNILNSGDVPNIYAPEDLDKIYQTMRGPVTEAGLAATKSNLMSAYLKSVRSNLHCVITMSPIGEVFRARLRQFPALVNCCTIDWFTAWPDSALQSVAERFMEDLPQLEVSKEVQGGIVRTFQYMHQSVVTASELYLQELSRYNYVTPTSYLELLQSFATMLTNRKAEMIQSILRLQTGLDFLLTTAQDVKVMQAELETMKPQLYSAQIVAQEMLSQIQADREIAEETRQKVEAQEVDAAKMAEECQTIADSAQADLEEAMPMLKAAEDSLKALNKNDISEVRALKRPPAGVVLVLEVICIVKDIKPNKVAGSRPGEKVLDFWEPGRLMLGDPGAFLSSLVNFDKENMSEALIQKLEPYIKNPNFQPAKIITVSKACTSLCMWVHAIYKYFFVYQAVAPKKAALSVATAKLQATEAVLAVAKAKMKEVMDGLAILEEKLQETMDRKNELEANSKLCEDRLNRAFRLVNGLSDERTRWIQTIEDIKANMETLVGDILISAGCVAYMGPFTDKYRRQLLEQWVRVVATAGVPHTHGCTPVTTLGQPVTIRRWQLDGLPRDTLSTENAVLVFNSNRWPLFIDPQGQANRWVKNMGKSQGLTICKLNDRDLMRSLEGAVRLGKPLLIENIGTDLDPALDPILTRATFVQNGQTVVKLGDVVIPFSAHFRLYLTTRLANPHYTPEVSVKVLLVNFTLVPSGLQDQLLGLVVMQERPDLEELRSNIVTSSAQMKAELKEIEDRILVKLTTSEGSPVDNIDLILTLEASKVKTGEIKQKVEAAEITQLDIDKTRALYIPVANRGQILFFCLADLASVDPMYQYSLEWFINIFVGSMINTEKTSDVDERIAAVNDYFTFSLFSNVCRSLFEKNKLQFAFLLCVRIMLDQGLVDNQEWMFFLSGGSLLKEAVNPAPSWLSSRSWSEILSLENLPRFQNFVQTFPQLVTRYKQIFDSSDPHQQELPVRELDEFQKLLVLKCLRPDKVTQAMQHLVSERLGRKFIEPQTSDLAMVYKESSPNTPLVFVLSTGTDPAADLYKFADKMKMSKRLMSISLGQGQGPVAEKMFKESMEMGNWVFFQNCHLAPSWMPRLDHLVESINSDKCHKDFRVWLTSSPSSAFPVAILQNGCKMTVEPPRGIKANLLRAYLNQVPQFHDFLNSENPKVQTFKWMLFSLCLFHGVCLERRKFGPLGFNIPYEFTDGDLRICISQLHMFLLEYSDIPFKVLVYTAGHINYGGRVTDDWDRRCIMNILADYYNMDVISADHSFDSDSVYHQLPEETEMINYLSYIRELPVNDHPGLFGLHDNADMSCAQAATFAGLAVLLSLQPRMVGAAASSQDEVTKQLAETLLQQIPQPRVDIAAIQERYPVMYEESLNTVLVQEVVRFDKLLSLIHSSLKDLLKAIEGLVVMSDALEKMSNSLFTNVVPSQWAALAYPSLKPLGSWVSDLQERIRFLGNWIDHGIPPCFWISGFYFPQAFLTGCLQNFARKYVLAIDSIDYSFKVLKEKPTKRPDDGCVIYGLFLEGARWDSDKFCLDESRPKELYTEMSPIWLLPEVDHQRTPDGVYDAPVYKTQVRAGTLSTTGHSTNYVLTVELPTQLRSNHWIKRGVALICALDF
ncbi:dynein axonemal heavy chain 1-like [Macrosteles quadrilineatus]|uniref:dynein axonemal heavy chain 1-like n=1 Tax=Macrosteles quadrilineatus TaxID=74068 RepID=UPI0023E1D9F6|nr:dynein axonemal heavy chain 1-like [Macrosteles quadrilineatus]